MDRGPFTHRIQRNSGGGSLLVFRGPGSSSYCGFISCAGRVRYIAAPLPPGYKITGVSICYSVSDSLFSHIFRRIQLHQYRPNSTHGGLAAAWTADIPLFPLPPPPGGDRRTRACINTAFHATKDSTYPSDTCIDPSAGQIELDATFGLRSSRQSMYIEAVGLTYNTTCEP